MKNQLAFDFLKDSAFIVTREDSRSIDADGQYLYLLVSRRRIIYVGLTRRLKARMRLHRKQKAFDIVIGISMNASLFGSMCEYEFISILKPRLNIANNPSRPPDAYKRPMTLRKCSKCGLKEMRGLNAVYCRRCYGDYKRPKA